MARLLAFIVLLIPALMAGAGIKFLRDTLFGKLISPFPWFWLQFVVGIVFLILGLGFFAGYLLNKDRKNGRIAPKYQKGPK
ncbi:DUF2627 domain-containing protein [Ureibacillus sp. 179-F W5.1 NHS]|uniref:DUF2627 domain-containing protein n=1 Tax=Lysinibacillus halotolerans TaxID=1368476 RepID=A0A3M8H4Z8_9BACI|nr:DUF2627 domain-containing protein [Lysinibacillus halotolerans]RNC97359.1 DUF2627 domain-containing protein [Lysinibacillus halotolerans]